MLVESPYRVNRYVTPEPVEGLHLRRRPIGAAPMSTVPNADHAFLSDRHSSALVTSGGSVDWLALSRFDSPSVFGRLLGERAGHWQVAPTGEWRSKRRYVDRTLAVETTFTGS